MADQAHWKYSLSDIDLGVEEQQAVMAVLQSKWLTMGAVTQSFEREFAELHQAKHAIAVGNCTQALHMALLCQGIGPGDEVIVPSLSFVATANAVLYTGATPRFADITSHTNPTIDPASVVSLINKHTRAIIPMHYAGFAADLPELGAIARRYHIALIEDVAHAPGAFLDGKALGTWGDVGCFSFFSNKNLSTGEGGMLLTESDSLAQNLRTLRSHGMTSLTWDRHRGHANSYDVEALGYNNRIDEIRSAMGRVQLAKLNANNRKRLALIERYWANFAGSEITCPYADAYAGRLLADSADQPAGHILPIVLPDGAERNQVIETLKAQGIQTSIHYPPIHKFSAYKRYNGQSLPKTETYAAQELTLPLYPTLTAEGVDEISAAVLSAQK